MTFLFFGFFMIELGMERTFKKENLTPYKTHISLSLPQMVPRVVIFFFCLRVYLFVFFKIIYLEKQGVSLRSWWSPQDGVARVPTRSLAERLGLLARATPSSDIHLPVVVRNGSEKPLWKLAVIILLNFQCLQLFLLRSF